MKTVKYEAKFEEKASRLELFIRWIYMIPLAIVMILLMIVMYVAITLQFWYILFTGKRSKTLFEWVVKYVSYAAKAQSYFYNTTDERPPIFPEE